MASVLNDARTKLTIFAQLLPETDEKKNKTKQQQQQQQQQETNQTNKSRQQQQQQQQQQNRQAYALQSKLKHITLFPAFISV